VRVIDSAEQCADDVARRLEAARRLKALGGGTTPENAGRPGSSEPGAGPGGGTLRCFVTDDPTRFAALASRFLGTAITPPTWVPPDDLYADPVDDAAEEAMPLRRPA
jgi:hypothetical protein